MSYKLAACQHCNVLFADIVVPRLHEPKLGGGWLAPEVPFVWSVCKSCERTMKAMQEEYEREANAAKGKTE
jgi:hypothetical protein